MYFIDDLVNKTQIQSTKETQYSDQDTFNLKLTKVEFNIFEIKYQKIENSKEYVLRKLIIKDKHHKSDEQEEENVVSSEILYLLEYEDETKLKISSQSWSCFSNETKQYKRGWKPNTIVEFNGLLRIIILKEYFEIIQTHIEMRCLRVKLNINVLREQQRINKIQKQGLKHKEMMIFIYNKYHSGLINTTTMFLRDLIQSLLLVDHHDVVEYSAIFMGYLIYHKFKIPSDEIINIENLKESKKYLQTFINHQNRKFQQQKNINSSITTNYQFFTTPHQLCVIFSKLVQFNDFKSLYNLKMLQADIQCPVGFKYFQKKTKKFVNQRIQNGTNLILNFMGKNNYGVVSYNLKTHNIIALYDCKFSMATIDIGRVEEWLYQMAKPIVDKQKKSKILPLLRLIQNK